MLERITETLRESWAATGHFLREVRGEVRKVTWPQKKEIIGSTVVVIISVGILAIFLGLVDLVLQNLLTYVVR